LVLKGLTAEHPRGGTGLDIERLDVRAHEIVGIAGISGNGQQELLRALSGEAPHGQPGAVLIDGADVTRMDAAARRALGLRFVPEERLGRGAVPDLALTDNALLTGHAAGMVRRGLIDRAAVAAFARGVIDRFQVKCGSVRSAASSLSGGNLQKFIVGREMALAPKVMLLAQPTWGVDVGAAMLIRQAIIALRDAGVAVLVLSEELEELFMISDRIAVLAGGRLSPAVPASATCLQQVGLWMSGAFIDAPGEGTPHAAT
jgi:simple sugar transport system ATP-binding protein